MILEQSKAIFVLEARMLSFDVKTSLAGFFMENVLKKRYDPSGEKVKN